MRCHVWARCHAAGAASCQLLPGVPDHTIPKPLLGCMPAPGLLQLLRYAGHAGEPNLGKQAWRHDMPMLPPVAASCGLVVYASVNARWQAAATLKGE